MLDIISYQELGKWVVEETVIVCKIISIAFETFLPFFKSSEFILTLKKKDLFSFCDNYSCCDILHNSLDVKSQPHAPAWHSEFMSWGCGEESGISP